jgi:DNA polymerase I
MKRLIVVDISSFIFRAFYAIRHLSSPEGVPVNAVHGVWNMMFKLLSQYNPSHIVIARDTGKPTFRHKMYDQYKANRTEVPEELIPQFPLITQLVEKMNLSNIAMEGYEADDIIGSVCVQWENEFDEILIASGDKDLMQFVSEKVKVLDTMKDKIFDRQGVFEKMGVWPEQIVDYLSMVGDSSDNIPGMKGIGAKGAAKLLAEYDNLDNIKKNEGALKNKRVVNAFKDYFEEGKLSKDLVKIVQDLDLGIDVSESENSFSPSSELVTFFESLGFKSAVKKLKEVEFGVFQAQQNEEEGSFGVINSGPILPETKTIEVKSASDFSMIEKLAIEKKFLSLYTNFSSTNINSRKLLGLEVNFGNQDVYSLTHANLGDDLIKFFTKIIELSESENITVFTEHAKRDVGLLGKKEVNTKNIIDVIQLSYLVNQDVRADFIKLTKNILDIDIEKEIPGEMDLGQNALRSWCLFKLGEELLAEASNKNVLNIYKKIDGPLFLVLAKMESQGVPLNTKYLKKLEMQFSEELSGIESRIREASGDEEVNLRSSKQVGVLLFDKLGLPAKKKTKTGFSTDSEVLEDLAGMNTSDIPGLILKYRELDKLLSTYVKALPELVDAETKRIHTNFSQHTAATGRLASSNPNLQNIPIRSENGKLIRKAFITTPGNLLLTADYSQVELRLLAHFSNDQTMVTAFNNNVDIHAQTAAEVTGSPVDKISSSERSKAKAVNFGLMYGQSSFGLSKALKISRSEAKEYITNYFRRFSKVKSYLDELKEIAEDKGYSETYHGRKRFLPDIKSNNRTIKSQAERVAVNSPIQGTAADIIKLAMINIDKKIIEKNLNSKMLIQVHDELIFDVPENEFEMMKTLVREEMENVVKLRIPLTVDVGFGVNWFDIK